jgi:YVTN family beta-propeller protein
VAVTPDGRKVNVTNISFNTASAIDTATSMVTATIPVGEQPTAFGIYIQSTPRFAGMPGNANCFGQSVSGLARQFGGLNAAAATLGYSDVSVLQNDIATFCRM